MAISKLLLVRTDISFVAQKQRLGLSFISAVV